MPPEKGEARNGEPQSLATHADGDDGASNPGETTGQVPAWAGSLSLAPLVHPDDHGHSGGGSAPMAAHANNNKLTQPAARHTVVPEFSAGAFPAGHSSPQVAAGVDQGDGGATVGGTSRRSFIDMDTGRDTGRSFSQSERAAQAQARLAPRRVLVAEDDTVCRKLLVRLLKGLKFQVEEAEDGAVAAEMMRAALDGRDGQQPYTLVLSDYTMPYMDGPEAVAKMRACGYRGAVFGVTGNQLQADVDHFMKMGADRVLAKPLKVCVYVCTCVCVCVCVCDVVQMLQPLVFSSVTNIFLPSVGGR